MLTAQKRKFALALMSGASKTDAAIKAGYSGKSARSKGSQLAKEPDVIAFIERKKKEKIEVDEVPGRGKKVSSPPVAAPQPPEEPPDDSARQTSYDDPLEYLKAVMNGVEEDDMGRRDAAKAMLPYLHPKKGASGIKEGRNSAAKTAAKKFGAMAPPGPKLVVDNKG